MLLKGMAAFALLASAPGSTLYSDGTPPIRFQGEAIQIVIYANDISQYCGKSANPNYIILACTKQADNGAPVTILPNPCIFESVDDYAHLACHEMGHVNGWPATHGG